MWYFRLDTNEQMLIAERTAIVYFIFQCIILWHTSLMKKKNNGFPKSLLWMSISIVFGYSTNSFPVEVLNESISKFFDFFCSLHMFVLVFVYMDSIFWPFTIIIGRFFLCVGILFFHNSHVNIPRILKLERIDSQPTVVATIHIE